MDLMKFIVYLDWPSSEEAAWKSERTEKTKNKKKQKTKDTYERERATNWLKRKNTILRRTFDEGSLNFTIVHMLCSHMY